MTLSYKKLSIGNWIAYIIGENELMSSTQVHLLLSGGIDSTAALLYYKEKGYQVTPYFIHYGHKVNDVEYEHAKVVSKYYDTKLNLLRFTGASFREKYEIIGRNAFLILSVLMADQIFKGLISLGIHKGSTYYDCGEGFISTIRTLVDGYTGGSVQTDFPFLEITKNEIIAYCKLNAIPIDKTYSCEVGREEPCGKCPSCLERSSALKSTKDMINGVD